MATIGVLFWLNFVVIVMADLEVTDDCGVAPNFELGIVPWHVVIYSKSSVPYQAVCSGTLVTNRVVISAAHSFWNFKKAAMEPASSFVVALGKRIWDWEDDRDEHVQISDVIEIAVSYRFHGQKQHFQADIALLTLATNTEFNEFVAPVCLQFDYKFSVKQLTEDVGKIPSWSRLSPLANSLSVVETVKVIQNYKECAAMVAEQFRPYVTADKMGVTLNGVVQETGAGAGLVFPATSDNGTRYYLRGIQSVLNPDGGIYLFTEIGKHMLVILRHIEKTQKA